MNTPLPLTVRAEVGALAAIVPPHRHVVEAFLAGRSQEAGCETG
jgi:hypothetical protein